MCDLHLENTSHWWHNNSVTSMGNVVIQPPMCLFLHHRTCVNLAQPPPLHERRRMSNVGAATSSTFTMQHQYHHLRTATTEKCDLLTLPNEASPSWNLPESSCLRTQILTKLPSVNWFGGNRPNLIPTEGNYDNEAEYEKLLSHELQWGALTRTLTISVPRRRNPQLGRWALKNKVKPLRLIKAPFTKRWACLL